MLSENDIKIAFENKKEISENKLFNILEKNNFKNDFRIMILKKGYFLLDNINNVYIKYENMNDLNMFIKKIHILYIKNLPIKDYSKENINICYDICNNKCIFSFGNHKNCNNCNYYKDNLTEMEINNFEKRQNENLKNYYDMLENDFYR